MQTKEKEVPPALKVLSEDVSFFDEIFTKEQEKKNEIAKMFIEQTKILADKILEKVGSVNPELKEFLETETVLSPGICLPFINALIVSEIKSFQNDDVVLNHHFSFEVEKGSQKDDMGVVDSYCRQINEIMKKYLYLGYMGGYSPDNLDKSGVRIECKIYLNKVFPE